MERQPTKDLEALASQKLARTLKNVKSSIFPKAFSSKKDIQIVFYVQFFFPNLIVLVESDCKELEPQSTAQL